MAEPHFFSTSVSLLGGCHTLKLSRCNITDASVSLLGGCHTLDLSYCDKITIETINDLRRNGCNVYTDNNY